MTRNLEEFNGIYDGQQKTAFVIGAGTSLHFQDLEPLKNHITIAVNSGYVAAPWANYFVSDDWSIKRWSFLFKDLRESKTTIALLYEDKLSSCASWFGDRAVLFRHRKGINIPDKYIHNKPSFHIGETRSSLGSGIMIAHIMGCSKIVLMGVDGHRQNGCRYFWQLPHMSSLYRTEPYKKPYRSDKSNWDCFHKVKIQGQITDSDLIEINRSWMAFGRAVNKKCKVYNASENSTLTVFPKVNLERFLEDEAV